MKITPYLNFDGRCAEALDLYARVLGGEVTFKQTFGDSPMKDDVPPEFQNAVMHATLTIGDQTIQASDAPPNRYARPAGFMVTIGLDDAEKAKAAFAAFADGGTVIMDLQATFWTPLFGMVTDRFGIPWMINLEVAQ
ncbi:VOC family protein [Asticcacaulis sp. AC466]|uniref:VOC family protein n=1 Tax=Asticcacaulis sp. AC466 TaxID=1282362 RepID=UPI00041E630D|nr:VOC family protein [Asticcacaulis sp. AC466]